MIRENGDGWKPNYYHGRIKNHVKGGGEGQN